MSIRAAEIYKDILTMKNISEQAQESYVRNLRKKMNFLVEKVADWTLKWSEAWMKSKIGMYACKNGLYDA